MQALRRLAAQRLDHLDGAGRRLELVDVVDDEDEVASELGLERFADSRSEAPGPGGLVLLGSGAGDRGDGTRRIRREPGHAEPERVREPAREGGKGRVLGGSAVPRAVDAGGPRREERGLAETCSGDDRRQPPREHLVQGLEQPLARQERRGRRRGAELDGRGRAGWGYRRCRGGVSRLGHGGAHTIVPSCARGMRSHGATSSLSVRGPSPRRRRHACWAGSA